MSVYEEIVKPVLETITAVGTVVALFAFIATIRKNRSDEEDQKQQVILDQCKQTLEWAYNALMPDPAAVVPEPNRLNWLTAARHIVAYQGLRKTINKQPHIRIADDFEEFWRHRFYLALSDVRLADPGYWSSQGAQLINIQTTSALVILSFSKWPEGRDDPIDMTDEQIDALKQRVGTVGGAARGLSGYMRQIEMRHGRGTPSPERNN